MSEGALRYRIIFFLVILITLNRGVNLGSEETPAISLQKDPGDEKETEPE